MRDITQPVPERRDTYVELHRHLDGSLRPQTLTELASKVGVTVPLDLRFYPGMSLRGALKCFDVTLATF